MTAIELVRAEKTLGKLFWHVVLDLRPREFNSYLDERIALITP